MKKIPLIYSIPVGIAAVMAIFLLLGWTAALENRVYDSFLGMRPSPPQNKDIVLVEVDDLAVSTVGTWPISRSITADGLLLLKEMGARYAVFDIEYLNKSPRGVNASVLEETFPGELAEGFNKLAEDNTALVQALKTRRIPLTEASAFATQFQQSAESRHQELIASLQRIAIDNDQRLAQAVLIFGGSFLTVNIQERPDSTINPEFKKTAVEKFSFPGVKGAQTLLDYAEISPVIEPILSSSQGIGFTNVKVDLDGVRRRIDLLKRYGDTTFGQLAFTPFLNWVGNPALEVRPDAIVLKGARYPDGQVYDVTVPRAQDGSILINWPHALFNDSYRHLSFYYLYTHDSLYDDLVNNLEARSTWGYLDNYDGDTSLVAQAQALAQLHRDLLEGDAPPEAIADYRAGRDQFLQEVGIYLASKPDENLAAQLEQVLAEEGLSEDQRKEYQILQKDLPDWFAKTRSVYDNLMQIRTDEKKLGGLNGAFCILGNTNTGSTDLGVTPFQSGYPNVGTHASVANMLLQRQFVTDASPWWSWLLGLLGAVGLSYLLRSQKPVVELSVGGTVAVATTGVFAVIFIVTGLYLPVIPMATITVLSFLGTTFFRFLNTEKEKGFLRSAFSRYLSNDVIQQIIANPDQLRLGGQQKVMTAVFTDIKGFSTISEKMNPEELVFLLNQYLTGMSDIILDLQGTIDKYEGDAIIAFFGAPIDFDDHARRAALAAVRMKRMEDQLNIRFLEEKIAPMPLLTRIGINTGPMVVGNMGTNRKMDYTMIGDAVNLAARLEGVNKLYGTWILMSEDTKNEVGDLIITRKLDRVRVVGKSVPIRLYQAIEEKGHLPEGVGPLLETYHAALDHFEERRWVEARKGFDECLKLFPEDGPSVRYRKLSADYEKTPPPETWDGVFKMDTK